MKFRSLTLAGAAVVLTALPAGFVSTAMAAKQAPVQCMTDDGHGRFRPCSALYKREHPNWRGGNECMTDDGYGRYRPCDSLYKDRYGLGYSDSERHHPGLTP
jgi:hypothetical protein